MKRFAFALLLVPSFALAQTWKELGPSPISGGFNGRVSAVACSATDANKVYVGGADGGVWRTTDGGATWTVLTDAAPTSAVARLPWTPPTTAWCMWEPARPTMRTTAGTVWAC
ncbi:MAG: hypothetical protein HONBIEJF_00926 [Fimbriimonadaceae bacterium]|nr:hypothetical protein [Fimbriimonadaceae bacterium]